MQYTIFQGIKKKFQNRIDVFLLALILINFSLLSISLLYYSPPFTSYPDGAAHYRIAKGIADTGFKGIEIVGYRSAYHAMSAALSLVMPLGIALVTITIIFFGILLIYAYRIAFFISKNRLTALFTAFLAGGLSVYSDVGTIPSPVPQTIGMALGFAALYYYLRGDWKKTAAIFVLYEFTHTSVIFFAGLIVVMSVYASLKEKNLRQLRYLVYCLFPLLAIIMIKIILTPTSVVDAVPPIVSVLNSHISPLSFHVIVQPIGFIFIAVAGIIFSRKKIFSTTYVLPFVWFIFIIIYSQSYWFHINQYPPHRTIIYVLFPVAFFSATAITEKIKNNYVLGAIGILLLIGSISVHANFFENKSNELRQILTNEDRELLSFLNEKPVDGSILSTQNISVILELANLKMSTQRNFWLFYATQDFTLQVDEEKISYIIFDKQKFQVQNNIPGLHQEFSNARYLVFSVDPKTQYKKKDALRDMVLAFTTFYFNGQEKLRSHTPISIRLQATDTMERVCILIDETGIKIFLACPPETTFQVYATKAVLTELMDSYDKNYFYVKAGQLIRDKKIKVEPSLAHYYYDNQDESILKLIYTNKWVNTNQYSSPNQYIGNVLWDLGVIRPPE